MRPRDEGRDRSRAAGATLGPALGGEQAFGGRAGRVVRTGLLGIGLGLAIAWVVTTFMNVSFVPSLTAISAIAAVSVMIGIVFGFFPALRGARLDPIDALRHE